MNFATKNRFRLNLIIYRKVGQNSISYKGHNFYQLFRNYSQTEVKDEQINWKINEKNYRNARRRSYCYYGNGERWQRNKYTCDFDAWT